MCAFYDEKTTVEPFSQHWSAIHRYPIIAESGGGIGSGIGSSVGEEGGQTPTEPRWAARNTGGFETQNLQVSYALIREAQR